jgi:hypothetical protein
MGLATHSKKQKTNKSLVLFGALYDLIVVSPLAIPGLASMQLKTMFWLNQWLGFSGEMPNFEPTEMIFVNLFGVVGSLWVYRRLLRYEPRFVFWDLALRSSVSVLLGYYVFTQNVHALVWLFFIIELMFVVLYATVISRAGLWRQSLQPET